MRNDSAKLLHVQLNEQKIDVVTKLQNTKKVQLGTLVKN